ncbi:glycoside hydrolase family 16 protein [Dentipellis sp. KUC8613]|nr:glycoside hydrolase family 16 protein [Dentipellis sp. KUC8613]
MFQLNQLTSLLVASVPLAVLAGNPHEGSLRHRHHQHAQAMRPRGSKTYNRTDYYRGQDIIDNFDFFTGNDPTHGTVNFLSQKDAEEKGLAYVQKDGTTILAVDNTTSLASGKLRNSVRVSSKKTYSSGLFVADFWAMPVGCGTWPAWWSSGPNWPDGGEIDVVEGVNNVGTNQMTLHSDSGCTLTKNPSGSKDIQEFTGNVLGTQCASSNNNNAGCAISDTDNRSFGPSFNSAGGGVFVHTMDESGIKMWHFARSEIPQDILDNNPDPTSWPKPAAFFSSSSCDISKHFYDHVLTLDITLCGDWASGNYPSSGCPGTCADAVMDPKNFDNARWAINYIAVYT